MTETWLCPRPDEPAALTLGCMNFGKRTPADQALAIIDRALGQGVPLLDTANLYNRGESERIVGRALRGHPGSVAVATKVGLDRVRGKPQGLSRDVVLAACDASLKRLGIEQIDLYYLHAPDPRTPQEETLAALGQLLQVGKIRHWGVSNHASWQVLELRQLALAADLPPPAVAQQLYNPLVRQLDIEYFRFAARYGVHTTVYNPLAGGLLAGRHRFEDAPADGSRFAGNRFYHQRYWSRTLFDAVELLRVIAAEEGMDLVTLTYAFLLEHPGVDSVLVGPGTVAHLDAALDARRVRLSLQARKRILAVGADLAGTTVRYAR